MKNASEPSWSLIPGWEKAATNTFRGQKVGPPCMVAKWGMNRWINMLSFLVFPTTQTTETWKERQGAVYSTKCVRLRCFCLQKKKGKKLRGFVLGLIVGAGRQLLASYANGKLSRNFTQVGKKISEVMRACQNVLATERLGADCLESLCRKGKAECLTLKWVQKAS